MKNIKDGHDRRTQSTPEEEFDDCAWEQNAGRRELRSPDIGIALTTRFGQAESEVKFKRIPTQFIAALADPNATSGSNAQSWGLWSKDPGPRGVWLSLYPLIKAAGWIRPCRVAIRQYRLVA